MTRCIGDIDVRRIEGRIEFDGTQSDARSVLHAVTLQGLPFVVPAQEQLVGFACCQGFRYQCRRKFDAGKETSRQCRDERRADLPSSDSSPAALS